MVKKRGEAFRFTIRRATDMRDSGKEIYQMGKVRFLTGMDPSILDSSKTILSRERDNIMMFRTKMLSNRFTKMVF
jgi:hypothetical protein